MPNSILPPAFARSLSPMGSGGLPADPSLIAGEACAKNSILIAIARPACNATTTISRILEVLTSVALSTGYLHRSLAGDETSFISVRCDHLQVAEQKHGREGEAYAYEGVVESCTLSAFAHVVIRTFE